MARPTPLSTPMPLRIGSSSRPLLLLALAGLFAGSTSLGAGCAADAVIGADDEPATAVMPGKADDYLSPTSLEYGLWGLGEVSLDASYADKSDADKEARVQELLAYRLKAYTYYINEYLTDKEHEDANASYGGFAGLVRGTSLDWVYDPMDDAKLTWAFIWELEMGGPRELMDRLPFQVNADGDQYLEVKMPVLTDYQLEYSSYPRHFDPATYTGEVESIEVMVQPKEASADGYPEYAEMFADGALDVMVIIGGDYNEAHFDRQNAQAMFDWLQGAGYQSPVDKLADLRLDSGPFTKTMKANGQTIAVNVTLVHPDIVPVADLDQLRDAIIEGYKTADVVFYDGHAGQDPDYSGVVYHYHPRYAISATALGELPLPEKYQIYVFNGCKTYSVYPEAVMANETKTTKNLDIVSTVDFAWLSQQTFTTSGFLVQLMAKSAGQHDPRTWGEILAQINKSANANVYYGVHGIDDNPHLNPYADTSTLCEPCRRNGDCPGNGNLCVRLQSGSVCGAECTADDACPEGYRCADIAVGAQITGRQCLPSSFTCQ